MIIGRVTATEKQPTSCTKLFFWVDPKTIIRPFDIVRVKHLSQYENKYSYTYAIVQNLEYITDSASHLAGFVSFDFGDTSSHPQNDRIGTTIAEAEVLYNDGEIEMPVHDGAEVEWADSEGVKEALGVKAYKEPIPAGYISMSNGQEVQVSLEADYLLGPEGAHLNIAGISGLATKTSYVMFLLNSIQQKKDDVSIIIFNVKGADLLSIDEENPDIDDVKKDAWRKCGLDPAPFHDVTYLYPFTSKRTSTGFYTTSHAHPDILSSQIEQDKAYNYFYSYEDMREKFDLLFSDIDDPNSTFESIFHEIASSDDFEKLSWDEFMELVRTRTAKGGTDKTISVLSWRKFYRLLISRKEKYGLFTGKVKMDSGAKRLKSIRDSLREIKPGKVIVIDIEPLPFYLQCLVVGDVIQTIYGSKLGDIEDIDSRSMGRVVIFADELNKFAPKQGEGGKSLTQSLLEVTERGRSLGTVLFGAEQFRSGVHDRVLGNSSTNVYGRSSPVEITKCPDYRYFPEAYRSAITRLPQGSLLIQHAVFKTALVKVLFPFPVYFQPKG